MVLVLIFIMRSSGCRIIRYTCPSVCRSVCMYVHTCSPLTPKTEKYTMFKLRSNWQINGHWGRKCENRFGSYLREKCINSRKTNTRMTLILCCTFCVNAAEKMRSFRENQAIVFEQWWCAVCWTCRHITVV